MLDGSSWRCWDSRLLSSGCRLRYDRQCFVVLLETSRPPLMQTCVGIMSGPGARAAEASSGVVERHGDGCCEVSRLNYMMMPRRVLDSRLAARWIPPRQYA